MFSSSCLPEREKRGRSEGKQKRKRTRVSPPQPRRKWASPPVCRVRTPRKKPPRVFVNTDCHVDAREAALLPIPLNHVRKRTGEVVELAVLNGERETVSCETEEKVAIQL
ncbi:hypothetical protein HPB48_001252 [Haemaphysalis longicornis]|uniref:Uncharacterized protein n=1 Tax=Haemaphysalis longicornis TaxID=44386 RepID=A0A9J6FI79_HAELO|nr:hypothetical protein HPB48_001252 [Haemaphysalis longicornis]